MLTKCPVLLCARISFGLISPEFKDAGSPASRNIVLRGLSCGRLCTAVNQGKVYLQIKASPDLCEQAAQVYGMVGGVGGDVPLGMLANFPCFFAAKRILCHSHKRGNPCLDVMGGKELISSSTSAQGEGPSTPVTASEKPQFSLRFLQKPLRCIFILCLAKS